MASIHSSDPFPESIDRDAFGHWLSGFVDGEGCFRLVMTNNKHPHACFSLCLRADDSPIIKTIHSYFQCGQRYPETRSGVNGTIMTCYRVTKAADLAKKLVPHFVKYPLRAKKSKDFDLWKQGVELISKVHWRSSVPYCSKWYPEEMRLFIDLLTRLKEGRKIQNT